MLLTLDCETWLIAPGRLAPPVVSVCVAVDSAEPELWLARDPACVQRLGDLLDDADLVVGHNVAFDLACIVEQWPQLWDFVERLYSEGKVEDTMLNARLADIATTGRLERHYSLDALAQRWLHRKLDKGDDSWRLRYADLQDTPIAQWPDRARDYAIDDVKSTRDVWRTIGPQATSREQAQAAWGLHLTSACGFRADETAVRKLEVELRKRKERARPLARDAGYLRADGTVTRSHAREAAGVEHLTRDVMRASGDAGLAAVADWEEANKITSVYMRWLRQAVTEPVHPRYTVLVESGRTSSASPNIQQLPRGGGVRETLRPRAGHVFVVADYMVAEMVCLAQVLLHRYGTSTMATALKAGRDLHLTTAATLLGVQYDEAVRLYKAGDPKAKEARQLSKGINFGAPGGLGKDTLAQLLGVTVDRAQHLLAVWLATYPELKVHFRDLSAAARGGEFTMVHPLTGYRRAGLTYTSGANHWFQHLCAAGAKSALFHVAMACFRPSGPLAGCRPWAFVHDEIVLECPEGRHQEAAKALETIMVECFSRYCPDVPVRVEALAARRWSKDAKPVWKHGRLEVWE